MTRRPRPKKKKKLNEKDRRGLKIFVAAGIFVLVLIMIPIFVPSGGPYDEATLCPTDRPYPRTIVVVDKTDPFTVSQSRFLRAEIERLRDNMAQYEKLAIYVLNQDNFAAPESVFELCNPGSGKDANALYQNPTKIRLRFKKKFGQPLADLLADLITGERADRSPIMEMIRNVAYMGDFNDQSVKRRLILISDMLQHMPGYSHYRSPVNFEAFAASDYFARIKAPLPGVNVHLIYLVRRGQERNQTSKHLVFWERFFQGVGAKLVDVRYGP